MAAMNCIKLFKTTASLGVCLTCMISVYKN